MTRFVSIVTYLCLVSSHGIAQAIDSFSFRTDILPILTKSGCNGGACHGAATGQGGFKLSLFGYDPEEDFFRITRELGARRIDLQHPKASLLLRKPSRQLDHEGGLRLPVASENYSALFRWIEKGAPRGNESLRVLGLKVTPPLTTFTQLSDSSPLSVEARLSDGSVRDVTSLAVYNTNDDGIAHVDSKGVITPTGKGLTSVMIRFGGQVAAVRVVLPLYSPSRKEKFQFSRANFIDDCVQKEWKRMGVIPVAPSSDEKFLRRVFLDLTGQLPSPENVRDFLKKESPSKRKESILKLLLTEEYVDLMTFRLEELFLLSGKLSGGKGAKLFHEWLRSQVAMNRSFKELCDDLLHGGEGSKVPPHFYTLAQDPRDLAEHAGRMFWGMQIGCARCHAHPTDRWTQSDYYQFAAYFTVAQFDGGMMRPGQGASLSHPKTGKPVAAAPLIKGAGASLARPRQGATLPLAVVDPPVPDLAEWFTRAKNGHFAEAFVNRTWSYFFGKGLVNPVNDLRPTNPATHPELLTALARFFEESNYDIRKLVEQIVTSNTYQLDSDFSSTSLSEESLYTRGGVRALPSQVLLDILSQATGEPERFEGYEAGTRAVQLIGTQTTSYTLDVLGRCVRSQACDVSGASGGGLAQSLHWINGETMQHKISNSVRRLLGTQQNAETADAALNQANIQLIQELYLRTLSRPPRAEENRVWESMAQKAKDRAQFFEDLLWTLLNSHEFGLNH